MAEQTRRDVLVGGLAALAGCSGSAVPVDVFPDPPPVALRENGRAPHNVVLIYLDDVRWDLDLPNVNRLASEGARCTDSFVTTSLCCPSRATLLTGLYAHAHGVLDNSDELQPAFRTFAQLAQAAGRQTAWIGKWHMGAADPHPRPGFDRWIGFRGQGRYDFPGPPGLDPLDRGFSYDGELREQKGYVTDLLTDEAIF